MATGPGEDGLWEDLFDDEPTVEKAEKEKKEKKKDKKDKSAKEDKKAKKEGKGGKENLLEAEPEPVLEKKEKKAKEGKEGKKDKKDKKDKKEKKSRDQEDAEPSPSPAQPAVPSPVVPSPSPVVPSPVLPVAEPQDSKQGKKEKKSKEGKEGKDKKDKKDKKEGKEGKDKKDKKDKKEKKDKKRKAEGEADTAAAGGGEGRATTAGAEADLDPFAEEEDMMAQLEQPAAEAAPAPPSAAAEPDEQGDVLNDFFAEALALEEDVLPTEPEPTVRSQDPDIAGTPTSQPGTPNLARGRKKKKRFVEEQEEKKISERFSQVLDDIKVKRPLLVYEQDSVPYIERFVEDMNVAAQSDQDDLKAGRPMLNKLALVPKAVAIMQKYAFADLFVSSGGCDALARWLEPMPDGQLPNVHLRTELLKCMMRLPINKEALLGCSGTSLGKVVKMLQSHSSETVENRKRAGLLVQKWVNQVLLKPENSLDLDAMAEEHASAAKPLFDRPPPETAESLAQLEAESDKRMHPRIPMPEARMYQVQPLPTAQPLKRDRIDKETVRGKLQDALNILCRPNKKAWKPYDVCIAGKSMNAI